MYVVRFPNGTVYSTALATSEQEAREQSWIVELNAMSHRQGHGFKNKEDFMSRIVVTDELDVKDSPEDLVILKCPKCGKAIEGLMRFYPAVIPAWITLNDDGSISDELDTDCKVGDYITDDENVPYHCPLCEAELFQAGQEHEVIMFLKRESQKEEKP